jgi:hypothetical protein
MQGRDKGNADEAEEKHECTRRQQTDGASPQSSGRAIERQPWRPLLLLRCMLSFSRVCRVCCAPNSCFCLRRQPLPSSRKGGNAGYKLNGGSRWLGTWQWRCVPHLQILPQDHAQDPTPSPRLVHRIEEKNTVSEFL